MKPKKIVNNSLTRLLGVSFFIAYPLIFVQDAQLSKVDDRRLSVKLAQISKHGVFRYYITYLKEYLGLLLETRSHQQALKKHRFENECVKVCGSCDCEKG